MKLCVYQGTFNPIHNGHLTIANFIRNNYSYDTILFIPAFKPPHKEIDIDLADHRYEMVKAAIVGENKFSISNIEYQSNKFSFTYNTIVALYTRYKIDNKIGFIIGSDAFDNIESWYEIDKLKTLVEFLVFPREDDFKSSSLEKFKQRGFTYRIIPMPHIKLSSSDIRNRIKSGKSVSTLVPEKILLYIQKNRLYLPTPEDDEND